MEQHFVTDYMKDKEREGLFKGIAEILTGYMLVSIAVFTVVAFYYIIVPIILVIAGIISFVLGMFNIRKVIRRQ